MLLISGCMQTAMGHILRSPSTTITDSCISFLQLGCLPWSLEQAPTAVPIFRDICMPQDANPEFSYQNQTVGLLQMAHTPEACEKTCRIFACGSAHIARSKVTRCCLWAQALYVAIVREHEPPIDLGGGGCHPRTQHMQLINCDWMREIADDVCPSAPRGACAETRGLNIEALELEDSVLASMLSMSTLMALVLAFLIAQVCILCVKHASMMHRSAWDAAESSKRGEMHAALLPPTGVCSCK
jgi:hypothetical protein